MNRRLIAGLLIGLILGTVPVQAQRASTTKAQKEFDAALTASGYFGVPRYATAALPTCATGTKGALAFDTTAGVFKGCDGSSWASVGGLTSPVSGDYVLTGKWTFGSAADAADSVRLGETANSIVFEGSGADANEATLTTGNPSGDVTITIPVTASTTLAGLALANVFTNAANTFGTAADAADSLNITASGTIVFEGSGADANELTLSAANPSGDVTITIPATASTTLAGLALANVFTNASNTFGSAADAADSLNITASGTIVFEGSGADANELTLAVANPGADVTVTIPATTTTLTGNAIANVLTATNTFGSAADAANSLNITASGTVVFEGSSADDNELTLTSADPGSDVTVTIPATTTTLAGLAINNNFTATQSFAANAQFNAAVVVASNQYLCLKTGANYPCLRFNTSQTPDAGGILLGAENVWLLIEGADDGFDFAHATQTNPTLFIHSSDQTTDEWISFATTTDGVATIVGNKYLSIQGGGTPKSLTESSATAFVQVAVASGGFVGGVIYYTINADDSTDFQARSGKVPFAVVNKAGTETCVVDAADADESVAVSTGTLTNSMDTDTSPTNACNFRATAASSLTQTTLAIRYRVDITSGSGTVTPQ